MHVYNAMTSAFLPIVVSHGIWVRLLMEGVEDRLKYRVHSNHTVRNPLLESASKGPVLL